MSYFISRSIHVPLLRARDSLGAALATWRLPARMAVRRCIGSMVGVGRPLFEGLRHSSLVRGRGGGHIRRTSKMRLFARVAAACRKSHHYYPIRVHFTGRSCAYATIPIILTHPACSHSQPAHACANLVRERKAPQNQRLGRCLERQRQTLDDEAELLVRAVAADLLGHQLAQHRDHRQAAVLQLLELLLGEDLRRARFG
mgnify:CR=1 FL=1